MTIKSSWRFTEAQAEALSSVMLLWATSLEGDVTAVNPSWERFTGQAPRDYMGSGWLDAVHPGDSLAARESWRQAVASQERLVTRYRLRRSDGEYRLMAVVGTLVLEGGMASGWVGSCQDITESHRSEVTLRQSEERLRFLDGFGQSTRTLVDASEIMAITARQLGEYLGATRCAYADVEPDGDTFTIRADWSRAGVPSSAGLYSLTLFGTQAMHNLRRGVDLVVNDVDRELGDEGGARMFNAIGIKAIVCAPLVKAGKLVAMMAVHQANPRIWTEQELTVISEVVDRCWAHIERVRATSLLREQDRRKDEFLATLAHELRNPLAPMRYAIAIMERVPAGSGQAMQAQRIINRQVDMMARLVDDLLDLSRINRGMIELRKEPVDLRELLAQAVETSHSAMESAGHDLQTSWPPEPLMVEGDRARLIQIASNLLNNAAKYTPQGGHVRIAAWAAGNRAVVEVADNGVGIPPQEQGKLFQMFTQLPHTASRSQGGLGIGLSLVKKLVQMHEGVIRVYSAGLDQGSTFTVELPLISAQATTLPSHSLDGGAVEGGRRVLVVEDNDDGRESLVSLLELMGYQVAGAADGLEGLETALRWRPHIALLDLGMPLMDGLTLAKEMRTKPELKGLRLVALTGWGTMADRDRTRAGGFDEHVTKPIDPDDLQSLLERLLDDAESAATR